jgi:hypothetical protein
VPNFPAIEIVWECSIELVDFQSLAVLKGLVGQILNPFMPTRVKESNIFLSDLGE